MTEYRKWISYLCAYCGEVREKNVGFVRVEARDDCCRLSIGVKGCGGCDPKNLDVGLYIRQDRGIRRIRVGEMRICDGCGQFSAQTKTDNMFDRGISLAQCDGVWLTCDKEETIYLASWEQSGINIREFGSGEATDCQMLACGTSSTVPSNMSANTPSNTPSDMPSDATSNAPCGVSSKVSSDLPPIPSLWESLCRYYPRLAPDLAERGVELLQIRLADIRYLPRRLWHYSNNSFLLHGYYHHKHLILGHARGNGDVYLLGVRGRRTDKERGMAAMFGFRGFLPLQENGQEGYWYTQITL